MSLKILLAGMYVSLSGYNCCDCFWNASKSKSRANTETPAEAILQSNAQESAPEQSVEAEIISDELIEDNEIKSLICHVEDIYREKSHISNDRIEISRSETSRDLSKLKAYKFTGERYQLRYVLEAITSGKTDPKAELISPDYSSFNPSNGEIFILIHDGLYLIAQKKDGLLCWVDVNTFSKVDNSFVSYGSIEDFLSKPQTQYKLSYEVKQALSQPGMPQVLGVVAEPEIARFNKQYTQLILGISRIDYGCKFDGQTILSDLTLDDQDQVMLVWKDDQNTFHNMILKLEGSELIKVGTAENSYDKWKCKITGLDDKCKEALGISTPPWIKKFTDQRFISQAPSGDYYSNIDKSVQNVKMLMSQKEFSFEVTEENGVRNIEVICN